MYFFLILILCFISIFFRATKIKLAEEVAYTCWQMYERQPTGIGPERVKGLRMDLSKTDTREYILRPEVRIVDSHDLMTCQCSFYLF
jgi:hypothetical protein